MFPFNKTKAFIHCVCSFIVLAFSPFKFLISLDAKIHTLLVAQIFLLLGICDIWKLFLADRF